MLNRRLGLDMAGNLKLGIDKDLFSDEDLLTGMKNENQVEPFTVCLFMCSLFIGV